MFGLRNKPIEYQRLVWVVLAVALLFSGFFLVTERVHACEGEECPICAMLETTQKNIFGALPELACAALVVFLAVLVAMCAPVRERMSSADTLVARKVRLDT